MFSSVKASKFICISATFVHKACIHATATCFTKMKRPPYSKHFLPEPIKTSWGRMIYRGMVPKEPVTAYTTEPIPVQKTGGRSCVTGRIEIRRIGGGKSVLWHMADLHRITSSESDPKIEMVREIIPEQTRSAYLALVAGEENKRWIIATDNMKVGDVIKSTRDLPDMPIQAQPGDCHPVGALPIGTQICCVERLPYDGARVANAAGSSALIMKKVGNQVVIKMPSKREMIIDETCLCVVGRVSNTERNKVNLGKAGAARWLGIRPKSGYWLRKTGLAGRKIKPIKKPAVYDKPKPSDQEVKRFTLDEHLFKKRKRLSYGL